MSGSGPRPESLEVRIAAFLKAIPTTCPHDCIHDANIALQHLDTALVCSGSKRERLKTSKCRPQCIRDLPESDKSDFGWGEAEQAARAVAAALTAASRRKPRVLRRRYRPAAHRPPGRRSLTITLSIPRNVVPTPSRGADYHSRSNSCIHAIVFLTSAFAQAENTGFLTRSFCGRALCTE